MSAVDDLGIIIETALECSRFCRKLQSLIVKFT